MTTIIALPNSLTHIERRLIHVRITSPRGMDPLIVASKEDHYLDENGGAVGNVTYLPQTERFMTPEFIAANTELAQLVQRITEIVDGWPIDPAPQPGPTLP